MESRSNFLFRSEFSYQYDVVKIVCFCVHIIHITHKYLILKSSSYRKKHHQYIYECYFLSLFLLWYTFYGMLFQKRFFFRRSHALNVHKCDNEIYIKYWGMYHLTNLVFWNAYKPLNGNGFSTCIAKSKFDGWADEILVMKERGSSFFGFNFDFSVDFL